MIPTNIEKDIQLGKARYRTFQTGMGGQSVLPVSANSYIVIFGYDYSPAGGGMFRQVSSTSVGTGTLQTDNVLKPFETQQISFYTGQSFHPFIHHVNIVNTVAPIEPTTVLRVSEVDNTPQYRGAYIISTTDVAITVGLINRVELNASSTIPVTNKTPNAITYGGSTANMNVESTFSSNAANPIDFVQPSLKQFADYGLGGVPGNASDQAFAIPDQTDGLIEPTNYLAGLSLAIREQAASNYFVNVHYALYTNQIPEQLG